MISVKANHYVHQRTTITRVEIAHIRDSSLIGQLIRSCLRQGCVYADFVNKSKHIITKKFIHDILTHVSVKYCSVHIL